MIDTDFILTHHAKKKWKKRFSEFSFEASIRNVSRCNKNEIAKMRKSSSHREIKKSKLSNFNFYKIENHIYIISEYKYQARSNSFLNVIITVFDINEDDQSRLTDDFKMQMIVADHNLKESSLNSEPNLEIKESEYLKTDCIDDSLLTKSERIASNRLINQTVGQINSLNKFLEIFSERIEILPIDIQNSFSVENLNDYLTGIVKLMSALNKFKKIEELEIYNLKLDEFIDFFNNFNCFDNELSEVMKKFSKLHSNKFNLIMFELCNAMLISKKKGIDSLINDEQYLNSKVKYVTHMKKIKIYKEIEDLNPDKSYDVKLYEYADYILSFYKAIELKTLRSEQLFKKRTYNSYLKSLRYIHKTFKKRNNIAFFDKKINNCRRILGELHFKE